MVRMEGIMVRMEGIEARMKLISTWRMDKSEPQPYYNPNPNYNPSYNPVRQLMGKGIMRTFRDHHVPHLKDWG